MQMQQVLSVIQVRYDQSARVPGIGVDVLFLSMCIASNNQYPDLYSFLRSTLEPLRHFVSYPGLNLS